MEKAIILLFYTIMGGLVANIVCLLFAQSKSTWAKVAIMSCGGCSIAMIGLIIIDTLVRP
jgi:hypothetical protein